MFQVYKALSTIIRESNAYHHTQQLLPPGVLLLPPGVYPFAVNKYIIKMHPWPGHCTSLQSTALTYFKIQVSFQPQAQDKYSDLEERVCFVLQILEYHSN
jgi:hypothetical protein